MSEPPARPGPPPLRPFGLVLHHDGRFSHEGQPIRNRRLREHFERSVAYLPAEGKFVVRLRHFRGEVEVEEAAFFVREVDLERGEVVLSDGSREPLRLASLEPSPIDGAWLCRVKHDLAPEGLLARFTHAAQAELLAAVRPAEGVADGASEAGSGGFWVELAGRLEPLPQAVADAA